jgi:hypothetical protein
VLLVADAPSVDPAVAVGRVLLLQHRTPASDKQARECVAWVVRWKVTVGLGVDHQDRHPTFLTKYRARLLLHRSGDQTPGSPASQHDVLDILARAVGPGRGTQHAWAMLSDSIVDATVPPPS